MKRIIILAILCVIVYRAAGQDIPKNRLVNWQLAGFRDTMKQNPNAVDFVMAGGKADGITANDSVYTSLLNNQFGPLTIYFAPGQYVFTRPISLKTGVVLKGFSSDSTSFIFKPKVEDHLFKMAGSQRGLFNVTTEKLYKDSNSIHISDTSIIYAFPGDYVLLAENDSALVTSSWALYSTGQLLNIEKIKDHTIYFSSPLRRDYNSGRVTMRKIDMVQNAGIENIKIVRLDSTVSQTSNIYFQYAANCHVKCVESINCNFAHVELNNSTNIEVTGSYFHLAFNYGDGGKGYGVVAHLNTGECLIENNNFDRLRHSMLVQAGANGNVFAYNYSTNAIWAEKGFPNNAAGDIVLHGNYGYANLFEGNVVQTITIDNSHGSNGPNNTFFRNRALLYGLVMSTNSGDGQNFEGNEITNARFLMGNFILYGTENYQYGNNLVSNVLPSSVNIKTASMFLKKAPAYYQVARAWPPIGPPNSINKNTTEAQTNGSKGFYIECSYPAQVPPDTTTQTDTTTPKDTTKAGIGYMGNVQHAITAYPNPSSGDVTIAVSAGDMLQVKEISVVSAVGQEIFRVSGSNHVSLGTLADGLYILNVRLTDGTSEKIRVIKRAN